AQRTAKDGCRAQQVRGHELRRDRRGDGTDNQGGEIASESSADETSGRPHGLHLHGRGPGAIGRRHRNRGGRITVADTKPDSATTHPRADATEGLVAYLDGELDSKAAESMATRLSLDPTLRAEADALQRAWDVLDILPRPQPSAAFATRTVSQVVPVAA